MGGSGGGGGWSFPSPPSTPSGAGDKPSEAQEADGLLAGGPNKDDKVVTSGAVAAGGGGGVQLSGEPCDIRDSGTLRSPNPAVVGTLSVGAELEVVEQQVNGMSVLATKRQGVTAGVIDCAREQDILDCIGQGHVYRARIDSITGGAVSVTVRRVGP